MARDGADAVDIAETVVRGVELDIRRDGGAPAFPILVDIIVAASQGHTAEQVLNNVDGVRASFADSPLTQHLADAAEKLGLSVRQEGQPISQQAAAESLMTRIAISRCCDGMVGYVARNRTKDFQQSQGVINSIKAALPSTANIPELARRMLNCSEKGLPGRRPKAPQVNHTSDGLNEEI